MAYRETVLVTGAGGSVGIHLVKKLLEHGFRVKATDLPGKAFPFGGYRVKDVRGDLTDPGFVEDLPYGVDHVIHAGASVDLSRTWDDLYRVNVEATVRLWEKAVELGIERFVFFSSASIYRAQERLIQETDPLDPVGSYEKSKFLAERNLMRSKIGGAATHLVILRPALVLGPHATVLMANIATVPPLCKSYLGYGLQMYGGPRTNVVHSLDVALAAIHLLKNGEDSEAYNVANDEVVRFCDFFNVACQEYGLVLLPAPPVHFPPTRIARRIAPILERPEPHFLFNRIGASLWNRLKRQHSLRGDLRPRLDREVLLYATRNSMLDSTKLKGTGFEFRFPDFRSVIRDTIEWYRTEQWIP